MAPLIVLKPRKTTLGKRSTAWPVAPLIREMCLCHVKSVSPKIQRVSDRHAARQIRNVCREIPLALLDHDSVSHAGQSLRPACRKMLFNVPGCKSALSLPGTVTRLVLCVNWRWGNAPPMATQGSLQIGAGCGGGAGCASRYRARIGSSVSFRQNLGAPISLRHAEFQ